MWVRAQITEETIEALSDQELLQLYTFVDAAIRTRANSKNDVERSITYAVFSAAGLRNAATLATPDASEVKTAKIADRIIADRIIADKIADKIAADRLGEVANCIICNKVIPAGYKKMCLPCYKRSLTAVKCGSCGKNCGTSQCSTCSHLSSKNSCAQQ